MSIWHWVILGIVVLLLFGKGRFSGMMGDVAKGLKEFKKGMSEEDEAAASASRTLPPRIDTISAPSPDPVQKQSAQEPSPRDPSL